MRVVVFGAGLAGINAWIALSRLPRVQVVAFVDNDSAKHGTSWCGTRVCSPVDLSGLAYDVLLVASVRAEEISRQLTDAGVPLERRVVVDPGKDLAEQLRARGFEPGERIQLDPAPTRRLAIFGTGAAALRAWESLVSRSDVEIVAFIDNDPRRRAERFLGAVVLHPSELNAIDVNWVVVASVHAREMIAQLLQLNVPPHRIVTSVLAEWLLRLEEAGQRPGTSVAPSCGTVSNGRANVSTGAAPFA